MGPPAKSKPSPAPEPIAWLTCAGADSIPLIPGRRVVVGRDETCDLRFYDPEISRRHVVFEVVGDDIIAKDQKSANGTFVNSIRVRETVANIGDVFQVGPFRLEIAPAARDVQDLSKSQAGAEDTLHGNVTKTEDVLFSGTLGKVSVMELLQFVEFHKKTGTLSVVEGTSSGKLVVGNGRPLNARWDDLVDDEAVRAMARVQGGRFSFTYGAEGVATRMATTLTNLLFDISRQRDESMAKSEAVAESEVSEFFDNPLEILPATPPAPRPATPAKGHAAPAKGPALKAAARATPVPSTSGTPTRRIERAQLEKAPCPKCRTANEVPLGVRAVTCRQCKFLFIAGKPPQNPAR